MKSHNIIYKNNKFYEENTGKRVFPKDGESFLIAGDNEAFNDYDPLNIPHKEDEILNSSQKLEEVKKIKNLHSFTLALQAQTDIFFDFSITKVKNEQEPIHYRFRIKLLEDLYLYKCTTWDEAKKPTFFECRCVVLEDIHRNIDFFEEIYAISLNEAYSKTRQFYFPNQGTAGASVYLVMELKKDSSLEALRNRLMQNLPWTSAYDYPDLPELF